MKRDDRKTKVRMLTFEAVDVADANLSACGCQ